MFFDSLDERVAEPNWRHESPLGNGWWEWLDTIRSSRSDEGRRIAADHLEGVLRGSPPEPATPLSS
jgi:hypothetical protein